MHPSSTRVRPIRMAFDDNLGLPAGLQEHLGCATRGFHDLGELLRALEDGSVDAAVVPVGTLPYLSSTPLVMAQTTLPGGVTSLTSTLVTASPDITTATQALGRRLGRVNPYCTTSYWAPLVTMLEHTEPRTHVEFVDADGFADMVASTLDGRSDAAMVWDTVAAKHPELAGSHEVLRTSDLPTPVALASPHLDPQRRVAVGRSLLALPSEYGRRRTDRPTICDFTGFVEPDTDVLERFVGRMRAAVRHFDIRVAVPVS